MHTLVCEQNIHRTGGSSSNVHVTNAPQPPQELVELAGDEDPDYLEDGMADDDMLGQLGL